MKLFVHGSCAFLLLFAAAAGAQTAPARPSAAPPVAGATGQGPGSDAQVGGKPMGSVATDGVCERVFEATSPLSLAAELAGGWLDRMISGIPLPGMPKPAQKPARSQNEDELRQKFKVLSRTRTWLPVEVEEMLGETMLSNIPLLADAETARGRRAADYARAKEIFDRLVAALPPDQPYNFRLRFSPDPSENLITVPGGTIVANTGIVQHKPELVAALMAHELAHATKRHYTRQIQGYIADTVTVSEVIGAFASGKPDKQRVAAWFAGVKFLDQLFTKFYADQELEADGCIPRLLKAAGYEQDPPARAFQLWALQDAARSDGKDASKSTGPLDLRFFDMRHPRSDDRVRVLQVSVEHWRSRDPRVADTGGPRLTSREPAADQQSGAAPSGLDASADTGSGDLFSRLKRAGKKILDQAGQPANQPPADAGGAGN